MSFTSKGLKRNAWNNPPLLAKIFINNFMDSIAKLYKNRFEDLQRQFNNLTVELNSLNEALDEVEEVELSSDTPDWVERWAKKFGDDPKKIEAMRLGVQSALGGDPTAAMNPNLTAKEVSQLGVKLDRDRKSQQAKAKSKKENPLSDFEGFSTPDPTPRDNPIYATPAPAPDPVPAPAPAPLPPTGAELNQARRLAKAVGADVNHITNSLVKQSIDQYQLDKYYKEQDRLKRLDKGYQAKEDMPEESLEDVLNQTIEQAKKQAAPVSSESLTDIVKQLLQAAQNYKEEYPVVPASPDEGKFEEIPEPSRPRVVKQNYSRPFDDFIPKLLRDRKGNPRPSASQQPNATIPRESGVINTGGMNTPMSLEDEPNVINTGGMNTPMSLEDEPEEAPKANTGISKKMRAILDQFALANLSPAELKKVLDRNPQLKKLLQQAVQE